MTAPAISLTPDAEVIAPAGQPRTEWLAARRRGIGGSDLPGILGMSRYASPFGVYLDKIGELEDDDESEAAEWGRRLEPVVAAKFADSHPELTVLPSPGILANRDRPWQLVNVDGLIVDPGQDVAAVLEVKTANQWLGHEWDDTAGEVPAAALLQGHHELAVTGCPYVILAALVGGQRYVEVRVQRDEEMIERLIAIEAEFWDRVVRRDPPPLDGSKVTTDLLGRLYDVDPDSVRVLDPEEIEPLLDQRAFAKAACKHADEDLARIDNQIKALLGEKEIGVVGGEPIVTWKLQTRAGYTVAPTSFRKLHVPKRGAS